MSKLLKFVSVVIIVMGILMVCGGAWGAVYISQHVVQEKITTPEDASIPNVLVKGPLTLKAQADIIRHHTLTMTGEKTFAEMPRQIPKVDANGSAVLGEDGKPVMVANTARDIWITATTLITALNLGLLSYAFSGLAVVLGIVFILIGLTFYAMSKRQI